MKKLYRNMLTGLLGTTFGFYMMVAPAAVYAKSQPVSNVEKQVDASTKNSKDRAMNKVAQNPIEVVKASASKLGFNAKTDSFSLVSKSANHAVVSVRHGNELYNVSLKLNKEQWNIISTTKVKKSNHTSSNNNNSNTSNSGSSETTSSGTTGTTTTTSSTDVSTAEAKAVELMNADRRANGLSDLKVSSALTAVARSHAQDMVSRNFFSHTNPDGKGLTDRLKQANISYSAAGENIAENTNVQSAETSFMNSSGHRANILNSNYTTVGIGVAFDSDGTVYVVQDFIK
ncbi:serine protease [Sporomusaceae bacterium FL31]|nr:serine protease [Sporomusaceae bacterium FL31]GCE35659.1 serine protease [Sporomusaceae bacterium]